MYARATSSGAGKLEAPMVTARKQKSSVKDVVHQAVAVPLLLTLTPVDRESCYLLVP